MKYSKKMQELRAEIDRHIKDFTRSPAQYYNVYSPRYVNAEIFDNEMAIIRIEFGTLDRDIAAGIYTQEEIEQIKRMEAEFVERAQYGKKFRKTGGEVSEEKFSRKEAERWLRLELSYDYNNIRAVKCLRSYLGKLDKNGQERTFLEKFLAKAKAAEEGKIKDETSEWAREETSTARLPLKGEVQRELC
jgi:hypothetical protein